MAIEPSTIAEMAKHPNITSVKEACGSIDQVMEIASLSDISILSGDDPLTIPMISVGVQGVVSVSSNVAPREVSAAVQCALDGDFQAARSAHDQLLDLHRSLFVETNPIPVKAVLSVMGLMEAELRLPLLAAVESTVELAKNLVAKYKLEA